MFKGTNKLAKVLALALVMCMLPMAAFANAPTEALFKITTPAADIKAALEAKGVVTIEGETTSEKVTMIVLRGKGSVLDGLKVADFNEEIFASAIYAGQQAVTDGTFSFKFVEKAGVSGNIVKIYVGGAGANTSDILELSIDARLAAPTVEVEWYKGEALKLKFGKLSSEEIATWYSSVETFKINGADVEKPALVGDAITIAEAPATITGIFFADTDDEYTSVNMTETIAPQDKPAGTITPADYYVSGALAAIPVTNTDGTYGEPWEAKLAAGEAKVYVNGNETTEYAYDAEGKVLGITHNISEEADDATVALKIAVENYADTECATIKFVAPTKLAYDALLAKGQTLAPVDTNGGEEETNDAYHVVLPTIEDTYGASIAWEVSKDGGAYAPATVVDGNFNLERPAADGASEFATYELKAVITKGGSTLKTIAYESIKINKLGVPAFGCISNVEILKEAEGEDFAGKEVTYAEGLTLTANAVGEEGVTATYEWKIGETTVSTESTYAPKVADIAKTIKVTATPSGEFAEKGDAVSAEVTIALDKEYSPAALTSIKFTGTKLTAGSTAKAEYVLDKTYEDAFVSAPVEAEVKFYEVSEVETAEAAIAKVKDGGVAEMEEAKYTTVGNWAVIVGSVTYEIAGAAESFVIPVEAAIQVSKKSSSSVSGGPSLTPTNPKPVEPEIEDPVSGDPIANGAAAFTDVNKETYAWAYEGIDALAKAGVIKGITATTFGPEMTTTNAQVIALAVRIAGLKAADGATTDLVAKDHWVQPEMAAAEAADILGVFGGKVNVEEATTREIAFTLLYNALKAAGIELPETAEAIEYTDASSIDPACVEAITALTKAGIVNGMGDGTLAPKATITRAQLAKILGLAKALIK